MRNILVQIRLIASPHPWACCSVAALIPLQWSLPAVSTSISLTLRHHVIIDAIPRLVLLLSGPGSKWTAGQNEDRRVQRQRYRVGGLIPHPAECASLVFHGLSISDNLPQLAVISLSSPHEDQLLAHRSMVRVHCTCGSVSCFSPLTLYTVWSFSPTPEQGCRILSTDARHRTLTRARAFQRGTRKVQIPYLSPASRVRKYPRHTFAEKVRELCPGQE